MSLKPKHGEWLPINHEDFKEVYKGLRALPRTREYTCSCGAKTHYSTLAIYVECPKCGNRPKVRGLSASNEIQDLIIMVVCWLGMDHLLNHPYEDQQDWVEFYDDYFGLNSEANNNES